MGVFNRRNAFVGWIVWEVGKRVAKRKAKNALPLTDGGDQPARKRKAVLAGLAAIGGMLVFWRRRRAAPDVFGE